MSRRIIFMRIEKGSSGAEISRYRTTLKKDVKRRNIYISFGCATDDLEGCRNFVGAEYATNGSVEWMTSDRRRSTAGDPLTLHELRSVNGRGLMRLAELRSADTGDTRTDLSFCLASPSGNALFGASYVEAAESENADATDQIVQILKSIRFSGPENSGKPSKSPDQ
jgi:hypothetical protein